MASRHHLIILSLATFSLFIAPTITLKCQECSTVVTSNNGLIDEDSVSATECVETDCGEDSEAKCVSGYAYFKFKGEFTLPSQDTSTELQIDYNMNYFKGCASSSNTVSDCNSMPGMLYFLMLLDPNGKFETKSCEVEECSTDNCNNKTVEEINPAGPLEQISCYSCEKATINGLLSDVKECNSTNTVECPLGVSTCSASNLKGAMNGLPWVQEYWKGCGQSVLSSCSTLQQFEAIVDAGIEVDSCGSRSCEGGLCNNQTAEETSLLVGGGYRPRIAFQMAFSAAFLLWDYP